MENSQISCQLHRSEVDLEREFGKYITLRNVGETNYFDIKIKLLENEFCYPSFVKMGDLVRETTVSKTILIQPKKPEQFHPRYIPKFFKYEIYSEDELILTHCDKVSIDTFSIPLLKRFRIIKPRKGFPKKRYNLLFYGIAGATKTSLLNSFATLVCKSGFKDIAKAGGGIGHQTTTFNPFSIYDPNGDKFHFKLCDTWGLTKDTYKNKEFPTILKGELPKNYDMKKSLVDQLADLKFRKEFDKAKETSHKRLINSVIFVISCSTLADTDLVDTTRKYFEIASEYTQNPILVLSLVDNINEDIRKDPLREDITELEELKAKAATAIGIPQRRIFYGVNYTNEKERVFEIDKNNLIILYEALKNAENQYKYFKREDSDSDSDSDLD